MSTTTAKIVRCPCKLVDQSVCGAPMEVRESTSEKNSGREYYYCSAPCTGCPDVEHGFSHFTDEKGPRFPKTEAKRIKEEQKRDSQVLANANPSAALDASVQEGMWRSLQVELADIKELLRVLVARSNGSTDGSGLSSAPPAMIPPAKRQRTKEEQFEEFLRQQEQQQESMST